MTKPYVQWGVRLIVIVLLIIGTAAPVFSSPEQGEGQSTVSESVKTAGLWPRSSEFAAQRVALPESVTTERPGLALINIAPTDRSQIAPITLRLVGITDTGERYVLGERRDVSPAKADTVGIPIGIHDFSHQRNLSVYVVELETPSGGDASDGERIAGTFSLAVQESERTGSFRLLAGNDADPNRNTTTTTIYDYSDLLDSDNELESYNISNGLPPWELDRDSLTAAQAREVATRTDGYRHLASNPVYVAHDDRWISLTNDAVTDVVVYRNYDSEGPEYYVFAHVEPRPGYLPVRNAEVEASDDGSLAVINPNEAEVNVGEYMRYEERLKQGAAALTDTGLSESRYPASGDTSWFTVGENATATGYHSDRSYSVIADHWAGIGRVSPGVFYRGQFISDPGPMRVYAPTDFRVYVPPYYEEIEEDACSITRNNTTYDYDETEWESWSLKSVEQEVNVTLLGDGETDLTRQGNSTSTANIYRFDESAFEEGEASTIRVRSTVNLTLTHTYGERSPCGDWETTVNVTRIQTVEKTYGFSVHDPESLTVTVYAVDKEPLNRMYVEIEGERNITTQAIGFINVRMGGQNYTLSGPWRFYPLTLYESVATRTHDAVTIQEASYQQPVPPDTVPHLYRDYAEPGNMTVEQQTLTLLSRERTIKRNLTGGTLPPSVIHTTGDTPLYRTWGGTPLGVEDSDLSSTEIEAVDVFGNPIDTTVKQIEYEDTSLTFRHDGMTVYIRLTSNGKPLGGRTLYLRGAARDTAVTNSSGWVRVEAESYLVGATFRGTPWTAESGPYYDSVSDSSIVPALFMRPAAGVYEWLALLVNRLFIIAEWLALGLVLLWVGWLIRRPRSKQT